MIKEENHHRHSDHKCDVPDCTDHHRHHGGHVCGDPDCTDHHHHHGGHECGDPDCTDHRHHHHVGQKCGDPDCAVCHDEHEDLINDSLVISHTRSFSPGRAETTDSLREKGIKTFLRLGDLVSFEGVVAGHIKGVIRTEGGGLAFSLTRAGVVDVTELGGWKGLGEIRAYTMTVNVMTLLHADITEEDIFALMA